MGKWLKLWLVAAICLAFGCAVAQSQVQRFADVPNDYVHASAIEFCDDVDLMSGHYNGQNQRVFEPEVLLTRAQAAELARSIVVLSDMAAQARIKERHGARLTRYEEWLLDRLDEERP